MTIESSMDAPTQIRQSCKELLDHTDCVVTIDVEKIDSFLDNLDWAQYEDLSRTQRFPLNFSSIEDEINFIVLHGLLQFGSGYRKELHKLCDRGASDTIVSGLLGMFISGKKLDAAFLKQLSIDSISAYFNIPLDEEEQVSTGIYASKPGPLRPLAQMIQQVLVESGDILEKRKDDNFGAFVIKNLKPNGSDSSPSAKYLLQQLITTFPAFDDHRECHGKDVYLYKRAQLTVNSIHERFSEPDPELSFEDIDELTVTSDNVLPCVLHALDILKYTPELQQTINDGKELEAGTFECEVRAGAILACDLIVAKSNGKLSTRGLGTYLWRLGKESQYRGVERHATKNTFFY